MTPNEEEINSIKKSIDSISDSIKEVLKEFGVYNSVHDPLIDSCSQCIYLRDKAFNALAIDDVVIVEKGREGERFKLHPAFPMYRDITKELRGVLNDLQMNIRNSVAPSSDQLDELTQQIESIAML